MSNNRIVIIKMNQILCLRVIINNKIDLLIINLTMIMKIVMEFAAFVIKNQIVYMLAVIVITLLAIFAGKIG